MAISVEAIQAIGNLAQGLRTLSNGSSCFLLPILLLTIQTEMDKSYPFFSRIIEAQSNKAVILKVHKDYVPICMECLNDGTPDMRDAAFSALTAVAKSVGIRPLERSLKKLDDVRKKKLAEMIAGSGSTVSGGTSSAAVQNSGGGLSSTELGNKKGASVKSVNSKKVDGAGQLEIAKLTKPPEDIDPVEMNLDEIGSRLGSLIQTDIISLLKSALWKERLEVFSGVIGGFQLP